MRHRPLGAAERYARPDGRTNAYTRAQAGARGDGGDYEPGVWKNSPPMFTLSGIPEDSTEYVYGVFICDERLILLSDGNNMYAPKREGLQRPLRHSG
ncbi:MAG: hypothetical protein ACLS7Z_06855 [Christensenellales bacterium]